jgi:spore photoproduct lyase
MQKFSPKKILVEEDVADLHWTQNILKKFNRVPIEYCKELKSFKEPAPMTPAKKTLILARYRGEAIKPFPKIKNAINLNDYIFNPISNCHLECTYCILQSYLRNNPALTIYTNIDHFLTGLKVLGKKYVNQPVRVGTGELSDSLALDSITELSKTLIPFFAQHPNLFLELKTKSNQIKNLLGLEPNGHTVISFSIAPKSIIQQEELKCASLEERLEAAKGLQKKGYPIGLHLDPMIYFEGWKKSYHELIDALTENLDVTRIAWVSIGSLRFDKELKEIATDRFPQTKIFSSDFIEGPDGKRRYFKTIREGMYRQVWEWLQEWDNTFPRYLCMEPAWMWEKVAGGNPPRSEEVETSLLNRLRTLLP